MHLNKKGLAADAFYERLHQPNGVLDVLDGGDAAWSVDVAAGVGNGSAGYPRLGQMYAASREDSLATRSETGSGNYAPLLPSPLIFLLKSDNIAGLLIL
jgi:hypothetical protein